MLFLSLSAVSCSSSYVNSPFQPLTISIVLDSSEPVVTITAPDTIPAPGQHYLLNCTVEVMDGLLISPQVQWLAPNGMSITSGENVSIGVEASGNVTLSSLLFTGITTEQAGTYTCVADFVDVTSQMEYNVTVQSE